MRLLSNEPATPTTRRIRLGLDGRSFPYRAGQAASLAAGAGESTPYSIASAPGETAREGWLEFLVKVDRATRFGAAVERLKSGEDIRVEGPIGSFLLPEPAADVPLLFIAGGTGISPLRSMIRHALETERPGKMSLVYSARTPDEFAYLEEFRQLANDGRVGLSLTLTGHAREWLHARGRTGAEHLAELVQPETMAFICGPPTMTADLPTALQALGLPRDRIRTDAW